MLFFWSPSRRAYLFGEDLPPLGESYMRDVLEVDRAIREPIKASDEDDDDPEDTDE